MPLAHRAMELARKNQHVCSVRRCLKADRLYLFLQHRNVLDSHHVADVMSDDSSFVEAEQLLRLHACPLIVSFCRIHLQASTITLEDTIEKSSAHWRSCFTSVSTKSHSNASSVPPRTQPTARSPTPLRMLRALGK